MLSVGLGVFLLFLVFLGGGELYDIYGLRFVLWTFSPREVA